MDLEIKDSGDKNDERWLPVVGYENLYEVSDRGRVRSLIRKTRISDKENFIMKQKTDANGYFRVNLHKDGMFKKSELVSRMVAIAFIPNPENLPQVGHMDDNKRNNAVSNLYWTDSKENNNHNGKMEKFQNRHREKIDDISRKLSISVIGVSEKTGGIIRFESEREAGRNGFDSSKISMCMNGKMSKHRGYRWEKEK